MARLKSQTATEYLILIAIVIVVALVVVNIIGGSSNIGSSSGKKVSDYKLQSSAVAVDNYYIGTSNSQFKFRNNYYDTITITEFRLNQQINLTCNSSNTIPPLPFVLNIGQSVTINCSVVNSSNYILSDRKTPLIGILYIDSLGATRLAGNVLTYDAVSLSGGGNGGSNISNFIISGPTNGLVTYYSFDGNMSDVSGNGNNGNCTGATCPTLNGSGVIGSAYTFDGSNDYINTTNNTLLNFGTNDFAISFWINAKSLPTFSAVLGNGPYIAGSWTGFQVELNPATPYLGIGAVLAYSPSVLTTNNWYHIVAQRSSGNTRLYLNGVGGSQVSNNYNINPNYQIYIGRNRDDTYPRYFNGSIDEVRIYNRSLNSSEVLDLYNLGSAAADIVLAMDFNVAPEVYNGYATYIRDNSVYNNSGVLD